MSGMQLALWRPIPGTGRKVTSGSGSSVSDTVAMGKQTYAVQLSATTDPVVITIAQPAVAATAAKDVLIKATDPPLLLACAPGDIISAYGIGGAGVLYIVEMSH
jgi:hypothetical protein